MKKDEYSQDEIFTYDKLKKILDETIGKTLGEVDKNHVFDRTKDNPKITGIAGDVIKQSVLGYSANSDNHPDILVDGKKVEVKTTGIRFSKKKGNTELYEAKEPMSITAVSPKQIVKEEFYSSHFWHKLIHLLIIYYLYDSNERVEAKEYANFVLKGYEFHKFNDEDIQILKNDWETVRNFIIKIQKCCPDNPELQYPRISFELRDKLMYIDTAPKWPNPPRFRLKRSAVTAMVQSYFNNAQFEELKEHLNSFSEFDQKLHDLTMKYQGKTIAELINIFGISVPDINKLNKAISEQIVVRMFDGKSSKINKIDLFAKVGIIAKTICLSSKGGRTEDTKLFPIDFSELENTDIEFEDSSIYDYFMNHQVLCIIFEEKNKEQNFKENKFKGFKRISYDYNFINTEVRHTWEDLRILILNKGLRETPELKKDGTKKINPNGLEATSINFPKSCDHVVFVRGGGIDSSVKPYCIQGIHMYRQYIWIKGKYMVDRLKKTDLI